MNRGEELGLVDAMRCNSGGDGELDVLGTTLGTWRADKKYRDVL
jgi:hypothetical protein